MRYSHPKYEIKYKAIKINTLLNLRLNLKSDSNEKSWKINNFIDNNISFPTFISKRVILF